MCAASTAWNRLRSSSAAATCATGSSSSVSSTCPSAMDCSCPAEEVRGARGELRRAPGALVNDDRGDAAPVYDLRRARAPLSSSSESRGKPPSEERRCRSDELDMPSQRTARRRGQRAHKAHSARSTDAHDTRVGRGRVDWWGLRSTRRQVAGRLRGTVAPTRGPRGVPVCCGLHFNSGAQAGQRRWQRSSSRQPPKLRRPQRRRQARGSAAAGRRWLRPLLALKAPSPPVTLQTAT